MYSRDYLALPLGSDTIVITCDSIGAIGSKELDVITAEPGVVGRFLARVALMELISIGASLTALSCTFSVDPFVSEQILEGVYAEAQLVHPDPQGITIVTTEKNVPTKQTGAGITCVGIVRGNSVRTGLAQAGDIVVAMGRPKVGIEVSLSDPENADLLKLMELLKIPGVKDIVPAGSKGILYEAEAIAGSSNMRLSIENKSENFLNKSAGPATVMVFTCIPQTYSLIADNLQPLTRIGTLKSKEEIK